MDQHIKRDLIDTKDKGSDMLKSYPNFSEEFTIHTYARKTHLRGVISQNGKPIAFYSRKLTPK